MQQHKAVSSHARDFEFSKALIMGIADRTVTGIFCVHGNVDSGDGWSSRDRSHPGLFNDFLVDGRRRAVFLWQHRSYDPPTATIDRLFEVARADLPPAVLKYAPDATGGVAVERTYDTDEYSDRIFRKIQSGALTEMSYAYEATRWDYEKPSADDSYLPVRNIYEADLYDVSDVNWGMNPATSSDGSKAMPLSIERQTVHAAVKHYIERMEALYTLRVVKEGRRFSSATLKEIEESIAILREGNTASEEAIGRLEKLITLPDDDGKTARAESNALRMQHLDQRRRLLELGVTL